MDLKYIESEIGKKKLKTFRKIELMYLITAILISIIYLILCLDSKLGGIIFFSIVYIIVASIVKLIKRKHTNRILAETLSQEICLDGFINLCIYSIKKTEKKPNNLRLYKSCNYLLLDLIYAYLTKGDYKQVDNIVSFLEKRELDNKAKALFIKNKAAIAYFTNNVEEFNKEYKNFNELSNTLVEKIKNQILVSLDLQKYILENNESQATRICEQLINNKVLLNRVMGSYYKGIILEKNNNEEYKKYYKFVAENGNNLNIAKIASDKIGVTSQIKYKSKKHIGFKIFTSLLFTLLLLFTVFICMFYIEDLKPKKWDTGIIYINGKMITLPCTISEFEQNINVEIDTNKIGSSGYYNVYSNSFQLIIKENVLEGIKIDISNLWNDELDTELGASVVFPEGITANSSIEEIKEVYNTGIINPAMRDWSEEVLNYNTGGIINSYGFKYSGDKYDISIDCKNGKVKSIFYYYK